MSTFVITGLSSDPGAKHGVLKCDSRQEAIDLVAHALRELNITYYIKTENEDTVFITDSGEFLRVKPS